MGDTIGGRHRSALKRDWPIIRQGNSTSCYFRKSGNKCSLAASCFQTYFFALNRQARLTSRALLLSWGPVKSNFLHEHTYKSGRQISPVFPCSSCPPIYFQPALSAGKNGSDMSQPQPLAAQRHKGKHGDGVRRGTGAGASLRGVCPARRPDPISADMGSDLDRAALRPRLSADSTETDRSPQPHRSRA